MNEFKFSFLSLSKSFDFEIKSTSDISSIFKDFLSIFITNVDYENFTIEINPLQQNTNELKSKLALFVERHKDYQPKIQRINTYFKEIEEDEYFFFLPNYESEKEDINQLYLYLIAMKDNVDYEVLKEQMINDFGELFNNYDIKVFGEKTKNRIGELDKSKRICRFCGKSSPEVTFKKIAHTISEALGNKKIITNDECDSCNKKFGNGIENDLITYLSLYRMFFGVKGKNGVPKLKEKKNYNIENTGNKTIKIEQVLTDEEIQQLDNSNTDDFNVNIKTSKTIIDQNIYRTLVKYALGVIDNTNIPNFTETIKWINCENNIKKLPPIAMLSSYNLFLEHPQLTLYTRKNNRMDLPYAVAEFGFTFLRFVYIIPATSKDSLDFIKEEDYREFWNYFKHYSSVPDWTFKNLNSITEKKVTFNMNFEKNDKLPNG